MLVVKGEMCWLGWPLIPRHRNHCYNSPALKRSQCTETPWEIAKAHRRQAFCLSTEALRFSPGVSWRGKQNHTLQWTYVPQELRPCLNLKYLTPFHPVSLLSESGLGGKIPSIFHAINTIKYQPYSTVSLALCWHWHYSPLLLEQPVQRTGCGKLNHLDLPSAWCCPPAMNKSIAESFTAEQAFYLLLIELQKENMVR